VEFAATVPSALKFRGATSKYLLKRHLERRLPPVAVHRPKMGFAIPLADWLRGGLRDLGRDLLLSERARSRGYFVPGEVRRLWDVHQRGARNHSHRLWALMMLELWHRQFVDQVPRMAWPPSGCPAAAGDRSAGNASAGRHR